MIWYENGTLISENSTATLRQTINDVVEKHMLIIFMLVFDIQNKWAKSIDVLYQMTID